MGIVPGESPIPPNTSPPPSPNELQRRGSALGDMMRTTRGKLQFMPLFSTGVPQMQPAFVLLREQTVVAPRSANRVRADLMRRLGTASPLHSPEMRHSLIAQEAPEVYIATEREVK